MVEEEDETSKKWITPALDYMASEFDSAIGIRKPISSKQIDSLIAWEY